MGPVFGAIAFVIAFGLVWHIWWLVIGFFVAAVVTMIVHGFARDTFRIVPAQQVQQDHERWLQAVAAARPISRAHEREPVNQGLAGPALGGVTA